MSGTVAQRIGRLVVHLSVMGNNLAAGTGGGQTTIEKRNTWMRRINIAACALMLTAAASAPVMAQGNMGAGGRMDPAQMLQRTTDRLMTGITLSAAQTDSAKAVNVRTAAAAQTAMSSGGDMRTQMTEIRTNQRAALRAVLTADQQAVFDKNVADMDKARMSRPQP